MTILFKFWRLFFKRIAIFTVKSLCVQCVQEKLTVWVFRSNVDLLDILLKYLQHFFRKWNTFEIKTFPNTHTILISFLNCNRKYSTFSLFFLSLSFGKKRAVHFVAIRDRTFFNTLYFISNIFYTRKHNTYCSK